MISNLVLDLDGPLLDGRSRHYCCYSDILTELGFQPVPISEYWEDKRNAVNRADLLDRSGAGSVYSKFLQTWMDRIETREYLRLDRLQRDVIAVLSGWKTENRRLILATLRNNPSNLTWQLEQLGLTPFFDEILITGSDGNSSSKASLVRHALQCNLENAVWVGDTEVDIDAARELGIRICVVTCGLRSRAFLAKRMPDAIEDDLSSVAAKMREHD